MHQLMLYNPLLTAFFNVSDGTGTAESTTITNNQLNIILLNSVTKQLTLSKPAIWLWLSSCYCHKTICMLRNSCCDIWGSEGQVDIKTIQRRRSLSGKMKFNLASKISSGNKSHTRKEKMMKWVFQALTKYCN